MAAAHIGEGARLSTFARSDAGTGVGAGAQLAGTRAGAGLAGSMLFEPGRNYKSELQEVVQRTQGALLLPTYSSTAQGLPHARVFIAAVTIRTASPLTAAEPLPAASALPAACIAVSAESATAAAGQGQIVTLAVTGVPQTTRKKAEQAAAAAALSSSDLERLLQLVGPDPLGALKLLEAMPPLLLHASGSYQGPQLQHQQLQLQQMVDSLAHHTPTQQLHDLVAQAAWCMEPIIAERLGGPSHLPLFEARVLINGHLMAVGRGTSKSAASHAAAARALECMQPPPSSAPAAAGALPLTASNSSSSSGGVSAVQIQDASLAVFGQLAQCAISSKVVSAATATRTSLCTFLIQQGDKPPTAIALGTGTGFFAGPLKQLAAPVRRGKLLLDSHAEVVARRGLLRWLYAQAAGALMLHTRLQTAKDLSFEDAMALKQALRALPLEVLCDPGERSSSSSSSSSSQVDGQALAGAGSRLCDGSSLAQVAAATTVAVADPSSSSSSSSSPHYSFQGVRLRLRPGVKLHMYMSKAPCGDARAFHRPPVSSGSSAAPHVSATKPRQQLPVQVPAGSQMASAGFFLPSTAALSAHWPQGCAVLDPETAATHRGRLQFRMPRDESWCPVASATAEGTAHAAPAAAAEAGASGAALSATKLLLPGPGSMRKMCCSDKIARWNALGLQGALLGQVLKPVYVSSVTVGGPADEFCEGAVCRAICCRLGPDLSGLISSSTDGSSSNLPLNGSGSRSRGKRNVDCQDSKRQQLMSTAPGSTVSDGLSQLPARMAAAVQRGLKLPRPYRVNHPTVLHARPSSTSSRWLPIAAGNVGGSCNMSLNWNAAEPSQLEVCNPALGTAVQLITVPPVVNAEAAALTAATAAAGQQAGAGVALIAAAGDGAAGGLTSGSGSSSSSAVSRLSKARLFELYLQLMDSAADCAKIMYSSKAVHGHGVQPADTDMLLNQGQLSAGAGAQASAQAEGTAGADGGAAEPAAAAKTYAAAKARNAGYSDAKALLYQHFQQRGQQAWLKCSAAVPELEAFTS